MSTYPRVKPPTEYIMKYMCDTEYLDFVGTFVKIGSTDPTSPTQLRAICRWLCISNRELENL